MKIYKIIVFLLVGSAAIVLVSLFWQKPPVLLAVLIVLALIKHLFSPIKQELTLYILSGLLGPTVESLVMFSGAWSYTQTHIFNVPIWLPFLWGLAGITGITLYQGLSEK